MPKATVAQRRHLREQGAYYLKHGDQIPFRGKQGWWITLGGHMYRLGKSTEEALRCLAIHDAIKRSQDRAVS
jgi:hypothetical protein